MMNPCVNKTSFGEYYVNPSAFEELIKKNCTMPDIKNIIFNLKTEQPKRDADGKKVRADGNVVMETLENPILTTRINYIDGTYTVVQNSKSDPVTLVTVMLDADGNVTQDPEKKVTEVTDASQASKEIAITYSLFKRIFGKVTESGEVVGNGTGRILSKFVDDAYSTPVQEAKQKIRKDAAKRRHQAAQKAAAPKATRKSLYATVAKLDEVVSNMQSMFADVMTSKASK